MNHQEDLLTNTIVELEIKRIKLIPQWIKIFAWIFLVFGCFVPIVLIIGIAGYDGNLSLYGFETNDILSTIGIFITSIFILKGIVAFGILKEKDWAIKLGLVDAITGTLICVFVMIYPMFNSDSGLHASFRSELVALIPYLLKLINIKSQWESFSYK